MSLRSIINLGEGMDSAIGVNIHVLQDGSKNISYCVLKLKKGILSLIDIRSGMSRLEELEQHILPYIQKGVRVHLNISGRSLLVRTTSGELEVEADYNKLFPGIKREEFILQRSQGAGVTFFCLLRRDDFPAMNERMADHIHSVSLGPLIIGTILPFLSLESIHVSEYVLHIKDSAIASIRAGDTGLQPGIEVSGQTIDHESLLAYAAAVHLFLPGKHALKITGLSDRQERAPEYYRIRKSLFITGRVVLLAVLGVLVLKTMLYLYLSDEIEQAKADLSFYQGKNQKDGKEQRVSSKMKEEYDNMGWSINRLPLYYADQLAKTVPSEIQLNMLEVGVFNDGVFRKDKRYQFESRQVKVHGLSADPAALSGWIASLQDLSWIKTIGDQKYQYDNRLRKGVFEIMIDINIP